MTTLDALAPWPNPETAAPAAALIPALAVRAEARRLWAKRNVDDPFTHSLAAESIQADLALIDALKTLQVASPERADMVARRTLRTWATGNTAAVLQDDLRAYGIDPTWVEMAAAWEGS